MVSANIMKNLLFIASIVCFLSIYSCACAQQTESDDGVVSHEVTGPPHEWTREEMLLAQPMPMSGEERAFVFSNKSVQKLNEWSFADFKKYVSSPIGRRIVFDEGRRWIDIASMLKAQVEFASDFLAGRSKKPKPLSDKPEPEETQTTDMQSGSSAGESQPGASAASPGQSSIGDTPSMNLRKNLSEKEKFLKDKSSLNGTESKTIFVKLKKLRADISKYCKQYDELMETAKKEGKTSSLERAMESVLWE